jgi:N-carbamoyl-L-amino-acid hydrolase
VSHDAHEERGVALREICRIAYFRLADLVQEPLGDAIISMAEELGRLSEDRSADLHVPHAHSSRHGRPNSRFHAGGGTCHVHIDAVGNVVGVLRGGGTELRSVCSRARTTTPSSMPANTTVGSAFLLPIAVAGRLRRSGVQLPYSARDHRLRRGRRECASNPPFFGSRAIVGRFDAAVLQRADDEGITMLDAIRGVGRDASAITAIARNPDEVACFVEVHIEQGPVLLEANLPVGVVTGIAGSIRRMVTVRGLSGHAGTVPMGSRRDAAAARRRDRAGRGVSM